MAQHHDLRSETTAAGAGKRILLAYHYFPHYRRPILECLAEDNEVQWVFASGQHCPKEGLRILSIAELSDIVGSSENVVACRNRFLGPWLWQAGLCRHLLRNRYDAVVFLGVATIVSYWFAARIARWRGSQVFFWSHGLYGTESPGKRWFRNTFYRLSDGLLLYGHRAAKLLRSAGFPPACLYVIYNSLDYDKQTAVYRQLEEQSDTGVASEYFSNAGLPLLVFIGRLTPQKKLHLLLEAIRRNKERGFSVNCLIIGSGSTAEMILQRANELGIDENIQLIPETYDERRIGRLLHASDVCVSPGEVGLTAIHSMTYGTPVITHNDFARQMPEFEAVIAGRTGCYFERDSSESLADALRSWLQSAPDREVVRKNCRGVVEKYYNPHVQKRIISAALNDVPADTIFDDNPWHSEGVAP